jgi:hypothetical protein
MLGKIQSLKEVKGEMNFIINNSPLKVISYYDSRDIARISHALSASFQEGESRRSQDSQMIDLNH